MKFTLKIIYILENMAKHCDLFDSNFLQIVNSEIKQDNFKEGPKNLDTKALLFNKQLFKISTAITYLFK